MRVEVLLFAQLRELIGQDRVSVQRQKMLTVRDVWDGLRAQYPQIEGFGRSLVFSVNQEYAEFQSPIQEGDEIAVFPPVSGGDPEQAALSGTSQGDIVEIIREPIRFDRLVERLKRPEDGAVVVFDGIVRNNTRGRRTLYLEYEGYVPMALKKMGAIKEMVRQQWPDVNRVGIVHRLGRLEIGEVSVGIVITSAHRRVAFEACQFAIDTLKKTVPIWKKEFFEDGEVWVEGEVPSTSAG